LTTESNAGTTRDGLDRAESHFASPSNGVSCATNNGNVLSQVIQPLNATDNYIYDTLNRITSGTEGTSWSQTYVYDNLGNRAVLGTAGAYIPNPGFTPQVPSLTSPLPYTNNQWNGATYGVAGNLKAVNGFTFTFDAESRQTQAVQVVGSNNITSTYNYDGAGRRVLRVASGVTTTYVYDAQGQLAAEYAVGTLPASPCQTCYLTADHLGSTRVVTNGSGVLASRHDYVPFGEELFTSNRTTALGYTTDTVAQKFTAKERDAETGLDNFGARYNSSPQGRFTSPDAYEIVVQKNQGKTQKEQRVLLNSFISNPQAWNKYAYGLNNPMRNIDVGGRCSAPAGLSKGQTGVCVEAFIAAPRIGGIGLGDNRTFSSSGGTYRFRVDIRVDPGTNGKVSINSDAAMSKVGFESAGVSLRGKGEAQIGAVTTDESGNRQFDVTGTAINGFERFTGGLAGPSGDIQFDLSFTATPGGAVSLDLAQSRTFPSLEIYTYDSNGTLTGTLLQFPEQNSGDLKKPMQCVGGAQADVCPK